MKGYPMKTFCNCCKSECIPDGIGTGYAVTMDGEKICYSCADTRQRDGMKTASIIGAYISSDGRSVTTWTGGKLATVIRSTHVRLTRVSFAHGGSIRAIRAVDDTGAHWYGRGSPGLAVTLRRAKSA
jgi:hypothetical protein